SGARRNRHLGSLRRRRLLRSPATAPAAARRGIEPGEGPAYPRHLAGMAIDHQLHRPPRPVRTREEHAFLDLEAILVGIEGPDVAVGQHQHGAVAIGDSARPDGRIEMKADGIAVWPPGR